MKTTSPPGKTPRHNNCAFVEYTEKLEAYWARNLKDLDDKLGEQRLLATQLFQRAVVQVEVSKSEIDSLGQRVDDGFRALAEESARRELALRKMLDERLSRIEARDLTQDQRIQEIAGKAGKAGAAGASVKVASVVSSVVVGVVLAIQQLLPLLQ